MEFIYGPPSFVLWDNFKWTLQKDGYYKDPSGSLLHVCVWERINGRRLEPTEVVHHIDHNKQNNDPSNLTVMSRSEHIKHHVEERGFAFVPGTASRGAEVLWATREPRDCVCERCGTVYQSIGMRVRFCSPKCRAAHLRDVRRAEREERRRIRPNS